jgi:hypothetical protein
MEHLSRGAQSDPQQSGRRQQRDVVAGRAIHLYEVAPPKIRDPRRVQGRHSFASSVLVLFYKDRRRRFRQSPGSSLSRGTPSRPSTRDLSRKVSHPVEPIGEVKQFLLSFRDMGLSS